MFVLIEIDTRLDFLMKFLSNFLSRFDWNFISDVNWVQHRADRNVGMLDGTVDWSTHIFAHTRNFARNAFAKKRRIAQSPKLRCVKLMTNYRLTENHFFHSSISRNRIQSKRHVSPGKKCILARPTK